MCDAIILVMASENPTPNANPNTNGTTTINQKPSAKT